MFMAAPLRAEDRPMSVDDVLALERLDRATVSPDGTLVAAVVLRGALPGETFGRATYEIDPSRGDVWIIERSTGKRRNITRGRARAAGAWCATWSPDGRRLAFLSTRPEGKEPRGGDNVRLYVWNRPMERLRRLGDWAVVTQTRYGGTQSKLDIAGPGASAPDACMPGDENPPFAWLDARRLLVAALPPGRSSALLDASDRVYRHTEATREAMRAGREAKVSASGSGAERTGAGPGETAILAIVDAETGSRMDVAEVPAYPFNGSIGVRVSPDGRRAAVLATVGAIAPRAGIPWPRNDGEWIVEKRLGFVDLLGGRPVTWLSLPPEARLPVTLEGWSADGRTVSLTARGRPQDREAGRFSANPETGGTAALPAVPEPPPQPRPAGLPAKAELIAHDSRGIVWSENTPQGTFLRASAAGGQTLELLALNRHLANVDLGRTIIFDYSGGGGRPLKAAVLLPPGYRDGDRLPVIIWVYGGYTVQGPDDYFLDPYMPGIYNLRLYAAKGYAVLIPSIPLKRDGTQDHLPALAPAVLPAIDKLAAMGIADPARVGVMGQSYGGYTALGLATQTGRFRAVIAIAALSDLAAFHGAFDSTARGYPGIEHEKSANGLIAEVGGAAMQVPPYVDPDRYRRNSPLAFVDRVTAPVLLVHGEQDSRGSMYQSEAFFTELWRQGKTARILRYWGEDHALGASPATVRSVVDEIIRWFDKYLAPTASRQPR
jgi:dipeptidyl aminopeptidase/acylaminoacyl peptidase